MDWLKEKKIQGRGGGQGYEEGINEETERRCIGRKAVKECGENTGKRKRQFDRKNGCEEEEEHEAEKEEE